MFYLTRQSNYLYGNLVVREHGPLNPYTVENLTTLLEMYRGVPDTDIARLHYYYNWFLMSENGV